MKSIFSGDYSSNILRINQNHTPSGRPESAGTTGASEFSDVLAKLETHGRNTVHEAVKPPLNTPIPQSESDAARNNVKASIVDQTPIAPDLSSLITHFSIPSASDGPPLCPMANWGKSIEGVAAKRVKNLAPTTIPGLKAVRTYEPHQVPGELPGELGVPKAPILRSAARYEGDHVVHSMAFGSDEIRNVIETAGKFHGIDPALSMAVATAESSLRPDAVSHDGFKSKGLFQLLDTTGKEMQTRMGITEKYDPFDPALNAQLGVGYLRYLHDIFSAETDLGSNLHTVPVRSAEQLEKLAVAAFNAGQGNVAQAQARARHDGKDPTEYDSIKAYLPASTREYVTKVTSLRNEIDLGAASTDLA